MTRIRIIILSLLAAFAATVAAAGPVSAATTNKFYEGSGAPQKEVPMGEKIDATVGTAYLRSEIAGAKIMIECTTNTFSGEVANVTGGSAGAIHFTGCSLFEIKNGIKTAEPACTVTVPEFKFKDQLIEGAKSGVVEDEFKPNAGTIFVEIKIEGATCAFKSANPFKTEGTYIATTDAEGEVSKVKHEFVFTSCGSNITFATKKASFNNIVTNVEVGPVGMKKSWYVD
jgi:hypothetical protein